MNPNEKLKELKILLKSYESAVIAYSGGVDSTFLAKVATDVLGSRALAVTAVSETYTPGEREEAEKFASLLSLNHRIIETSEIEDFNFSSNPPERCYYCKKELFAALNAIASNEGYQYVLDGAIKDDLTDYRPGSRAVEEVAAKRPLLEVELTKEEIRKLSRDMGIPSWSKPSMACLASRIPYGTTITREKLTRIYKSEAFISSLGYGPVRVRDYGHTARIEIPVDQMITMMTTDRNTVSGTLKSYGYTYITVDIDGFRSGSMNEVLDKE